MSPGARVLVAGAGVTGRAVLAALTPLGVDLSLCDDDPAALRAYPDVATLSPSAAAAQISGYDLVVTSPGFPPSTPVLAAAAAAGVPIWGDVELAWRLDAAGHYGPPRRWLVVTGTNGKTTTTSMLHAMLLAAGLRAQLCGNIGSPVLDVLSEPAGGSARLDGGERKLGPPHESELLAVELSSFQLHWAPSLRPAAGAVLNIAEDHLDWHGGMAGYTADKARALHGEVAVVGMDDARAAALLPDAPAGVKVGFRLGEPAPGEFGVVGGALVDRAFADSLALAPVASIPVPGPVGVLDALAAAALARSAGVPAEAIAAALASFQVGRHRAELVAVAGGVSYVDDSKATNLHAAEASVLSHPRVVWVAGGLLKGATDAALDATVTRIADHLVGAVLIGRDRQAVAEALSRHAPNVPVVHVVASEDAGMDVAVVSPDARVTRVISESDGPLGARVMTTVVAAAGELAAPGDTVLLAPAGASFDQFTGYAARGEAFAAAARAAAE
ncbi:UDP-N-acetylmuramoyl-L-alanine--D-glutamate ligase [Mycobacterium sp. M1]|uniref:UDP-N-acetylmuramoylalanine--D-glutamate ligase n=1 Tax=Mycolicibacter acidiphilus TaxID=2835306 RepID=A0ABS5RHD6_9MYCO|nr:UDP-N-acetylmuramoyl-L-alanine--D-glutamate ligase [Mycolicibacter acidiphilus]MBS9532988.1 UDP-N-acetylmuramoyl-L-alanine--D-glutamate ligase [Mycolicibacter acidiphilus]